MIKIKFQRKENNYLVLASGHSEFSEKGRDIVCSAVSTLLQAAAAAAECDDEISLKACSIEPGFGVLEFSGDKSAKGVFNVIYSGVSMLSGVYPENVSFTEKAFKGGG